MLYAHINKGVERRVGLRGIAGADVGDQLAMGGNGLAQGFQAIAFAKVLNDEEGEQGRDGLFEHLLEIEVAGEPPEFTVELNVAVIEGNSIQAFSGVVHPGEVEVELIELDFALRVPAVDDFTGSAFQRGADDGELLGVFEIELADVGSPVGHALDEALVGERDEGFPHGILADAVGAGNGLLDEAIAGLQFAPEDGLFDGMGDLFGEAAVAHQTFGRREHFSFSIAEEWP